MNDVSVNSLWVSILNKPELICLYTVKWFQVLLFITSNSLYQVFLFNFNIWNNLTLLTYVYKTYI